MSDAAREHEISGAMIRGESVYDRPELLRRLDTAHKIIAALEKENETLKERFTFWCYSHDEIEAACGGEMALEVRVKVTARRVKIEAAIASRQQDSE